MNSAAEDSYSNAFDKLIAENGEADDLIGFLAYALYKKDKRELALSGKLDPERLREFHKTLTDGSVQRYREQALSKLETYSEAVVRDAEPEIQEATRTEAVEAAKNAIIREIKSATSAWNSIVLNVVAWLITLGITALVLFTSGYLKLTN